MNPSGNHRLYGTQPGHRRHRTSHLWAQEETPFLRGILAQNVHRPEPGHWQITLWNEWTAMLTDLVKIGRTLTLTRNSGSILGRAAAFPVFDFTTDENNALSRCGHTHFHLGQWWRAVASQRQAEGKTCYEVEVFGLHGQIVFNIHLSQEADLATFFDWVQVHQATGLEMPRPPFAPPEKYPASVSKIPLGSLIFPSTRLRAILLTCRHYAMPIRVLVGNAGAQQAATFVPRCVKESEGRLFICGEEVGLHIREMADGNVWLQRSTWQGTPLWTLHYAEAGGAMILQMTAGEVEDAPNWNEMITEAALSCHA